MELPLLDLYPLKLEMVTFPCAVKHIEYVNNNILEWHYYDDPLQSNSVLRKWEKYRKIINKDSAIYSHKNFNKNKCKYLPDFDLALDREFGEITTTLPVGQQLFRDTKFEDLSALKSTKYMPTSLVPGVYVNHNYDISLILTIRSTGIKCHYYGDTDGICEWEVLLQKGLLFTEMKRFFIPQKEEMSNEIHLTKKMVIEFDVTNSAHIIDTKTGID